MSHLFQSAAAFCFATIVLTGVAIAVAPVI